MDRCCVVVRFAFRRPCDAIVLAVLQAQPSFAGEIFPQLPDSAPAVRVTLHRSCYAPSPTKHVSSGASVYAASQRKVREGPG